MTNGPLPAFLSPLQGLLDSPQPQEIPRSPPQTRLGGLLLVLKLADLAARALRLAQEEMATTPTPLGLGPEVTIMALLDRAEQAARQAATVATANTGSAASPTTTTTGAATRPATTTPTGE